MWHSLGMSVLEYIGNVAFPRVVCSGVYGQCSIP